MADRELLVRILGDDRDLQRALGNTDRRLTAIDKRTATFGKNIGRAFAAAGIAVGTAEIFRLSADAVSAASDLNEQLSRTEVILGSSAQATIEWSQTTAESFGISQRAALAASATFAGLFQTVGVSQDRAAELSRSLVELAADLASLQNSSPEEALTALRSGLTGEIEPLRRFNIFLTAARVDQLALAQAGKENVKSLTAQEKALARYTLILRDSAPANGNFAATSGELANQSRILRAQLDDLSTNIGSLLIPALTDAAEAANLLFLALDKFRGVDFSPGFDFPELPSWLSPGTAAVGLVSPGGAAALTIKRIVESLAEEAQAIEEAAGPGKGIGEDIARRQEEAARATEQAVRDAIQAATRQKKAFAALVKGLGLKLDKAQLTAGLSDDVAALRELERAIVRQIAVEGKTFELIQQLTNTRLAINATVEQQSAEAKQAGVDAFNATVDALDLQLEQSRATASLRDDQAALRSIEQALLRRIETEGETTELLRRLFDVRQEQADVARQIAEQSRERRQGTQFEVLGLTAEGEERTASAAVLRRRKESLEERIKGTALDTKKNRQILENAAKVLSGQFGKVGKEVRAAIEGMFNDIAAGLNSGDTTLGPLTKTTSLNTKKLLQGLGLTADEINALRGRLSSFNSAGLAPAGFIAPGFNAPTGGGFAGVPVVVESHVTVELDGKKVGQSVTKEQQKARRRNPRQKRGPNRRGGEG